MWNSEILVRKLYNAYGGFQYENISTNDKFSFGFIEIIQLAYELLKFYKDF